MSRFIVRLQPTVEGDAEVVGPVEAAFAAGRSSRRVSAEENHRRVESTNFVAVLELDDGVEKASARRGAGGRASRRRERPAAATVRPSRLARLRPGNGRSQP